jgi:hypothetical protein
MPAGTPLERHGRRAARAGRVPGHRARGDALQAYAGTAAPINFNGLVRQYYLRAGAEVGDLQVNLVDKQHRKRQSHAIATRVRPALQPSASATAPTSRWWRCRPARRCCRRSWPRSTAPTRRAASGARVCARFRATAGHRGGRDDSHHRRCAARTAAVVGQRARPRCWACRSRPSPDAARRPVRRGRHLPARRQQVPGAGAPASCRRAPRRPGRAAAAAVRTASGKLVPLSRAGAR